LNKQSGTVVLASVYETVLLNSSISKPHGLTPFSAVERVF
jgi:hypothetical protein